MSCHGNEWYETLGNLHGCYERAMGNGIGFAHGGMVFLFVLGSVRTVCLVALKRAVLWTSLRSCPTAMEQIPLQNSSCTSGPVSSPLPALLLCFSLHGANLASACRSSTLQKLLHGSGLLVDEVLVKCRTGESHQVVETTGSLHNGGNCFRWLLHGGQQALEAVLQDAKCIPYNTTRTRQTVVEDVFVISEVPFGKWLHQPCSGSEGFISNNEVRCIPVVTGKGVYSWQP